MSFSIIGNIVEKINIFSKKSEKRETVADIYERIFRIADKYAAEDTKRYIQTEALKRPFKRGPAEPTAGDTDNDLIWERIRIYREQRFELYLNKMISKLKIDKDLLTNDVAKK